MKRTSFRWLPAAAALLFACADASPPAEPIAEPEQALLEGDEPADPVDPSRAGLRKGNGGSNGDGDFCDNGNCVATEGDCDSSAQCGGDVCLTDNGGRYADLTGARANQQDDHCAPATCNNFGQDGLETGVDCGGPCGLCDPVCDLPQHHAARCTYHCQCANSVGDCDSNRDCRGWDDPNPALAAVCGADLGARFGGVGTNDYCVRAHCFNRRQDQDETGIDSGGSCGPANCPQQRTVTGSECTPSCPCARDGGDCDSNLDCEPGLTCVEEGLTDRCRDLQAPPTGVTCQAIRAANPNAPDGIYSIDPDAAGPIAAFDVYCDMSTDGGGWTKVLQIRTPYVPNAGAIGNVAVLGVPATAKLSDAQIQAIQAASPGTTYFRFQGTDTLNRVYIRDPNLFNDPARAWGIVAGARNQCYRPALSQCGFFFTGYDSFDTLYDGSGSGEFCSRFFEQHSGMAIKCYASGSLVERCVTRGAGCQNQGRIAFPNYNPGYPIADNLELYFR